MGEDEAFDYLKKLHRNVTQYTRSGTAQAKSVAKGEVGIGVSFMFGFENERFHRFPVKTVAPCEGTSYEIGGIALVKGARNKEAAKRYYDWLMSPAGPGRSARAPTACSCRPTRPSSPTRAYLRIDNVRLIKYDFEKYGKAAESAAVLVERWTREVESQPR